MTKVFYIEETDFREEDIPNYYGLSLNKIVGLRYASFIRCNKINKYPSGEIKEIEAELIEPKTEEELNKLKSVKGHIHWISECDAIKCNARIYSYLFTVDNPNEVEDFLKVVNTESLVEVNNIFVNKSLKTNLEIGSKFQFERMGYFCVDQDSDLANGYVIFNRTIELNDKDKVKTLSAQS